MRQNLLAPFRKTVLTLQESVFGRLGDDKEIVIETIDRIQGLTVDCCIFLLTPDNPSFALNVNRFNVATSRAKYGTLIITDKEFVRFKGIDKRVTEYLYSLSFVQ
jgi:DNA replication ATP-dependent helicase Dna2